MKRYTVAALAAGAAPAFAELPGGIEEAISNMGIDIVSAVGLVLAAGIVVWGAREVWKAIENDLSGR